MDFVTFDLQNLRRGVQDTLRMTTAASRIVANCNRRRYLGRWGVFVRSGGIVVGGFGVGGSRLGC